MIRAAVYKQAPGLWFGDVFEDDLDVKVSLLECVNESSYRRALDGTLDALARAYQRRQLWGKR